eukprot:CAMPEP_0171090228 /NCGR_PEP_ID=MMETSP0766_2-20121228/29681_1 /TAXON_ID=439317 /ORGANISM="Gambierdiscus australes, Strain CAWD 149" /LENGTH=148 /DNA_ID=CAMNT_0011548197 /DNA_START=99 /DNA_END=542 /DNA_ORIENTATION=+
MSHRQLHSVATTLLASALLCHASRAAEYQGHFVSSQLQAAGSIRQRTNEVDWTTSALANYVSGLSGKIKQMEDASNSIDGSIVEATDRKEALEQALRVKDAEIELLESSSNDLQQKLFQLEESFKGVSKNFKKTLDATHQALERVNSQ